MAQATFSVRMDENLKRNFDTLCNEFGMNTSTAINIFARAVVRQRKIPFEITAESVDTKTSIDGLTTNWEAEDAINLFHAEAGTTTYTSDGQFTITAENLDSKKFTGTLASPLEAGNYDWYAIYPYKEQISSPGKQTDGFVYIGHSVAANQNGNNSNITPFKLCVKDRNGKIQPLLLEDSIYFNKTCTSVAFVPDKVYYYANDVLCPMGQNLPKGTLYQAY